MQGQRSCASANGTSDVKRSQHSHVGPPGRRDRGSKRACAAMSKTRANKGKRIAANTPAEPGPDISPAPHEAVCVVMKTERNLRCLPAAKLRAARGKRRLHQVNFSLGTGAQVRGQEQTTRPLVPRACHWWRVLT